MNIKACDFKNFDGLSDVKVIFIFQGMKEVGKNLSDEVIKNSIAHVLEAEDFKATNGEILTVNLLRKEAPTKLILAGLGEKENFEIEKLRKVTGKAIKEAIKLKAKSIDIHVGALKETESMNDAVKAISEVSVMSTYKFDTYKSEKKPVELETVNILACNIDSYEDTIKEGIALGEGNIITRQLVNEPANVLFPRELANRAVQIGEKAGFEVEVYSEEEVEKLGMTSFLTVGKGSDKESVLIVMRYMGDNENKDNILGLVGKGLTYDTGGYSLKPSTGMDTMKSDMGGAGAVIGAMHTIAKMKLKANVVGVIASCENCISGGSYKPGDIIGSMAGKTIEVLNTDAEGRLTLADAVTYIIRNEKVSKVIDIATLTGAVLVALGNTATGVVSNNDEFYSLLDKASKITGEKVWRLPAFDEYKELIKSENADLKNTGGRNAGTITAGLFIGEFIEDKPWLHLDIAGSSWSSKPLDYITSGATGAGARILYQLVKEHSK
ncbi:MAG: leucyl aminopeptidase [Clostridium argentinense]|uniref:leucyl aminopeptidase n=1 Tax=Clostridium butanoliproducens TaxID=2991837 RepID=UPI001DD2E643|nr:leucyl aminopeptidase [Clostridium butanoliproducens]MBS5824134.1 leucyl aminopeptidase [Clostridium argentinense]MDU1348613.1 leucyl aminopeptidase [Clostridium argentinense]